MSETTKKEKDFIEASIETDEIDLVEDEFLDLQEDNEDSIEELVDDSRQLSKLIKELRENRDGSKEMLTQIRTFRKKINFDIPKDTDFKNKFVVENKMSAISDLVSAELSVVKHLDDSIKTEFDLRRKLGNDEGSGVGIDQIAAALEIIDKRGKKKG